VTCRGEFGKGPNGRSRFFPVFWSKKTGSDGAEPVIRLRIPARKAKLTLILQLTLEGFDLLREGGVAADQMLDFTDGMQNSRMVTTAKSPSNLG
jgi:hypothetical protein